MGAVKNDDLAERLRVVTAAVPGLRRVGVTKLQLGDVHLEIDPPVPDVTTGKPIDEYDPDTLNPSRFSRAKPEDEGVGDDGGDE